MSDDDDDIALDSGMEPELTMEQAAAGQTGGGGADDDDDDGDEDTMAVLPAGGISHVSTPRGTRPVSDKVRQMLRDIGAKHKASAESADGDEDVAITDGIEEPYGKSSAKAPAGAAQPVTPSGDAARQPAGAQPGAAPTAMLDPEVAKGVEANTARAAELDAREQAIAQREQSPDMESLRELYNEKGAPAVVQFLKLITGLDGDAFKEEVADLVTSLSSSELGVDVPSEIKQRLDIKRAERAIKAMKADTARREQSEQQKKKTAEEAQQRAYLVHLLNEETAKPDVSSQYSHLMLEDNPGEVIMRVHERRMKEGRDPKAYTWKDAAKEANDFLSKQASAWFDKRRHLFSAAPAKGAQPNATAQPTRETAQGLRRSPAPPTQKEAPPPVTIVRNGRYDAEAHRRQTKAKVRGLFKPADEGSG